MKKIVMGILFSLLLIQAAGATDGKSAAKVLAKVGDLEITDQDMAARMAQIPPQYKNAYASDEGKNNFSISWYRSNWSIFRPKKRSMIPTPRS